MTEMTEEKVDPGEKTILIVDDDDEICVFLKTVLERDGFKTEIAVNGEMAMKIVAVKKIDLVILDWMMPILSGFEVLKMLQTDDHRGIPVLVITARAADRNTVNMIRQEMNVIEFMPKPLKHAVFLNRLHQVLNTVSPEEKRANERRNLPG